MMINSIIISNNIWIKSLTCRIILKLKIISNHLIKMLPIEPTQIGSIPSVTISLRIYSTLDQAKN